MQAKRSVAVVGGGPAGLRAAEVAAEAGASVVVYDQMRSVGRKFLVAGKSGLNLTNDADSDTFLSKYSGTDSPQDFWAKLLHQFDNQAVREWAAGLGVETFVAGGGKVFPVSKKAAPLLRRWVLSLKERGVVFSVNHRWSSLRCSDGGVELGFETPIGSVVKHHDACVLACGGGSWPQTGSDGRWTETLEPHHVSVSTLKAANCGWETHWSDATRAIAEGQPLHHLDITAGDRTIRGELMVTRYGFEGSPMYHLGRELRNMEHPRLVIDFKPMFTLEHMIKKMESARRNFYKEAQLRWKFTEPMCAILRQLHGEFDSAEALAKVAKCCHIELTGARPLEEAISTSGGVAWSSLDDSLMIKSLPNIYCAGEMIDWEAPTGGFLLQGCFATGTTAGRAAAEVS
ncbi:MAG: NAD(P)/FAD-dependent oxidoreductase [Opitutaceae bacterium]